MLPPTAAPRAPTARAPRRGPRQRAEPGPELLDAEGRALFEALRHHRLALARSEGVPPYVVASDRTLREIALLRPRNLQELELAYGIGPAKLEKYGAGLLAVVSGGGAP
jgi:ATP-dependent DNA helicase RecQ